MRRVRSNLLYLLLSYIHIGESDMHARGVLLSRAATALRSVETKLATDSIRPLRGTTSADRINKDGKNRCRIRLMQLIVRCLLLLRLFDFHC